MTRYDALDHQQVDVSICAGALSLLHGRHDQRIETLAHLRDSVGHPLRGALQVMVEELPLPDLEVLLVLPRQHVS